ncbi:MAG: PHP domain-containing protein [Clostridia bacterium]
MSPDRYYPVDLHIHTALSSCAENKMTPREIVFSALDMGLKAIAITDHNSCMNVKAVMNQAEKKDLIVIPGIEVESKEGVHVLSLFDNLYDCEKMQDYIIANMPKVKNDIKFFGNQLVFSDDGIKEYPNLLAQSTNISLFDICKMIRSLDGVYIPAHIHRRYNGLISTLGFLPDDIDFTTLEVSKINYEQYKKSHLKYNLIVNSDGHRLLDLYRSPTAALELSGSFNIRAILDLLSNKNANKIKIF